MSVAPEKNLIHYTKVLPTLKMRHEIDGLVKERRNSSLLAMELFFLALIHRKHLTSIAWHKSAVTPT